MSVTLRRIKEDDLLKLMNWRMDPDVTRYMNTNPKLTLEGQKKWFESISKDRDVSYYLIMIDNEDAGLLYLTGLSREDGVLGWSYYIGEKRLRSLKSAINIELALYEYIFNTLDKKALVSDVFSENKGVIGLHKMCGAKLIEVKEKHIEKEGIFYDVTFMEMTNEMWQEIGPTKKFEQIKFPE